MAAMCTSLVCLSVLGGTSRHEFYTQKPASLCTNVRKWQGDNNKLIVNNKLRNQQGREYWIKTKLLRWFGTF